MTLREVVNQICNLGRVNGTNIGRNELECYIRKMFLTDLPVRDTLLMSIELPDGKWLMTVERKNDSHGYWWWYEIPETREQETWLKNCFAKFANKY